MSDLKIEFMRLGSRVKTEDLEWISQLLGPQVGPVTPSQIEAKASESIARVLAFYLSHEIDLGYTPRVKYIDDFFKIRPDAAAAVQIEEQIFSNSYRAQVAQLAKAVYREFGLEISNEAAIESMSVGLKNAKSELGNDADIYLFMPVTKHFESLDELMAHEIWHLIQKKHGILGTSFTNEGTATFAQNLYAKRTSPWLQSNGDFIDILYRNSAHIVQEIVGRESNPYLAMLNPNVIQRIETEFDRRIVPLFDQMAVNILNSPIFKSAEKAKLREDSAYERFRLDPTSGNLLEAWRIKGYKLIVSELASQDMTKITAHYRNLLNPAP